MLLIPEEPARELGPGLHYFFLQDLMKHYLGRLFPGLEVREAHAFRMTRNSDLYIDEEEAENLLQTIEEELRRQSRGNAVRLEVQADTPPEVERFLLETFASRRTTSTGCRGRSISCTWSRFTAATLSRGCATGRSSPSSARRCRRARIFSRSCASRTCCCTIPTRVSRAWSICWSARPSIRRCSPSR